jgi:alkanesulfonate monooxygenase SsuD/methylene tetrahydromethanopterin reductase-like flavin-dependent oxidoreductase (luciferase family)
VSVATRPGGILGMVLPTLPQGGRGGWRIAEVAREAEEAGASALWACDHLAWHTPVMECFTALAMAATSTQHCILGTSVLQLPLRPAPLVAKSASSLQEASGGRFVLGIGVGVHQGEFEAMEADFEMRGKRTDEALVLMRELWRSGQVPPVARYRQLPLPEPIPVWVGGSSAAARKRAARLGDGWMPLFLPAEALREGFERLAEEVEEAGRKPDSVLRSLVVFVSCDAASDRARRRGLQWMSSLYGLPAEKFDRHLVAGSPAACAETLGRFIEAGAEHLALFVADDEPVEQFAAIASELGGEVVANSEAADRALGGAVVGSAL